MKRKLKKLEFHEKIHEILNYLKNFYLFLVEVEPEEYIVLVIPEVPGLPIKKLFTKADENLLWFDYFVFNKKVGEELATIPFQINGVERRVPIAFINTMLWSPPSSGKRKVFYFDPASEPFEKDTELDYSVYDRLIDRRHGLASWAHEAYYEVLGELSYNDVVLRDWDNTISVEDDVKLIKDLTPDIKGVKSFETKVKIMK